MSTRISAALVAMLLFSAALAAGGQIFLKLGAQGRSSVGAFVNVWIGLGFACYGMGMLIWIFALSRAPLVVVYPFTALTFVLVYTAGLVFFGETATARSLLGVGLVMAGLYLVVAK